VTAEYEVIDPATLELVDVVAEMTAADLDSTVSRAAAAQIVWECDADARRQYLRHMADILDEHGEELARLLSREQGKVISLARTEIAMSKAIFLSYADLAIEELELPDRNGRSVSVLNRPYGVVAAITPWNYPLTLLNVKLAPALLAGNTVVVKPARTTPLATRRMLELFAEILPPAVVQLVTGREAGHALAGHGGVGKVAFTGSTEVGQLLMHGAARTMTRLTLELGGNDAAIVLPESNLEFTVNGIMESAFRNAGQTCMSVKRVYVPRSQYAEYVDAFAANAARITVGRGLDESIKMGPLHSSGQLETVTGLRDDAIARGARMVAGGGRGSELPGWFHEATILADVDPTAPVVVEEQFGSVLPVVAYDDPAILIDQINQQPFGLGGSVWSADVELASALARKMDVGLAWVNQHNVVELDAPFGGRGLSGLGRERGRWGLESFFEPTTLNVRAQSA